MDTEHQIQTSLDAIEEIKTCCATAYQSEIARFLLGDSFHPGGVRLTEHLGALLHLAPGQRVLDVASGPGKSAITLAQRFGCQVLGIDYGSEAVKQATEVVVETDLSQLVAFLQGDAERLPVADGTFDAVICECAFCTFPDKSAAATEFLRVLKPGGLIGMSDLTRTDAVPAELQSLLAWIACIADAQPVSAYTRYLAEAGATIEQIEVHDEALHEMVQQIRTKLLGAELLVRLKKLDLPGSLDFAQAKALAKAAEAAIQQHKFGYAVIVASKAI